jgi:hypothetical protein
VVAYCPIKKEARKNNKTVFHVDKQSLSEIEEYHHVKRSISVHNDYDYLLDFTKVCKEGLP